MRNPQCWATMGPILACGDTNAAVDNLVEGLVNRKLRVVRLGQPAKVRAQCSTVSGWGRLSIPGTKDPVAFVEYAHSSRSPYQLHCDSSPGGECRQLPDVGFL